MKENTPRRANSHRMANIIKQRTPIGWYGGKTNLAARIIDLMPPHTTYVDPFFGGGSILFAKDPTAIEIVNDVNHGVANYFTVLRDEAKTKRLARQLTLTPYSRIEHARCLDPTPTGDCVEDARRFFVRVRQSFSSLEGNSWTLCFTGQKTRAADAVRIIDRLEVIAQRLRKVQIDCGHFSRLLAKCDRPETVVYCDPPYPKGTRSGNGSGYLHEMEDADHEELLDLVKGYRNAKVLVSGYRCSLYDRELKGWTRHEWPTTIAASRAAKKAKRTECLWMNC